MTNKFITKAPKRTKSQIVSDRARITDLLLMSYTERQIQAIINDEGGLNLSKSTIHNDISAIRNDWRTKTMDNYEELMNRELFRIDATEKEAWRAWRASCNDNEREIVEQIQRELEESGDSELVINKVTSIVDKRHGVGDPRLFDKVIILQKERRKLLGLYAPTKLGIDINSRAELVVKGYAVKEVSPDVWPDAIVEGEIVDPKLIEDKSEV